MNENDSQAPGGYYYQPLSQGGHYQSSFESFGQDLGQFAVGAVNMYRGYDPSYSAYSGIEGGIGQFVSSTTSSLFGAAGQLIDNLPTIQQNLNTMFDELNNSSSWMTPDL